MDSSPKVWIKQGLVAGRKCYSRNGVKFYSFQGIPYAKAPVGKLRFKAPEPPEEWKDDIFYATHEAPQSYQRHMLRHEEVDGSEDCLYLNVYTPEIAITYGPYPVMVWIHGGAFVSGSSKTELCCPDLLMSHDIVLVTFNYRVGMLGFMSLEDERVKVPGNAGLKDQVMALKWIQQNITKFRGDKENVTIWGQSSGAACVHLHMLSPMSQGLFHKAIMQSGCALNPWVNGVFNNGRLLANQLGIKGNDEKILEKLTELPVYKIFEAQERIANDNRIDIKWICSPIVEKQKNTPIFLQDEPIKIIRSGNFTKVPMIIGYTSREGIYWDLFNRMMTGKPEVVTDFTTVIPNNLNAKKGSLLNERIAERIRDYYYGPRLQQTRMGRYSRTKIMDPLYQIITDVFFFRGIHSTVKNHLDMSPKTPVFYYKFDYHTKLNVFKAMLPAAQQWKYKGAAHGDDINYFFNTFLSPNFYFGDDEDVAINKMVKMWTTFAETGAPTSPTGVTTGVTWWPVYKKEFQYLNICEDMKLEFYPDFDRAKFWNVIYQNDKRTRYL